MDGALYPQAGKLLFSDAKSMLTLVSELRGDSPIRSANCWPGMYVRVQIEQGIDSDAIAVPQQRSSGNVGGGKRVLWSRTTIWSQFSRCAPVDPGRPLVRHRRPEGRRRVVSRVFKIRRRRQGRPQAWAEQTRPPRWRGTPSCRASAACISNAELLH